MLDPFAGTQFQGGRHDRTGHDMDLARRQTRKGSDVIRGPLRGHEHRVGMRIEPAHGGRLNQPVAGATAGKIDRNRRALTHPDPGRHPCHPAGKQGGTIDPVLIGHQGGGTFRLQVANQGGNGRIHMGRPERQVSHAIGQLRKRGAMPFDAEHIDANPQSGNGRHQIAQHAIDAAVARCGREDDQISAHCHGLWRRAGIETARGNAPRRSRPYIH